MYIRRKVFSILTDEAGEERLYSINETLLEGYGVEEEREFAKKEEKVALKDVKSLRGIGRNLGLGGGYGLVSSRLAAKNAADKADEKGADDYEIVRRAKKAGTVAGAGAVEGAAAGALGIYGIAKGTRKILANKGAQKVLKDIYGKQGAKVVSRGINLATKGKALKKAMAINAGVSAISAGIGAGIAGRAGASKMTRSRLEKRHNLEQDKKNKKEDK